MVTQDVPNTWHPRISADNACVSISSSFEGLARLDVSDVCWVKVGVTPKMESDSRCVAW